MRLRILTGFMFLALFIHAQDSVHVLNEVLVDRVYRALNPSSVLLLPRSVIQELQPEDAGQILQKLAGVTMKSYGGLGGLKTISVRGLGSQHTSIVVDGFPLVNTQTGQINLGQVQADNIEQIMLVNGVQANVSVPASALVSGSAVLIRTFENVFGNKQVAVRAAVKYGSFGQTDNYVSAKWTQKRVFLSVFGKYRFAGGAYPYAFQNGNQLYEGVRSNNRYEDAYGGISAGWRISEKAHIQVQYRADQMNQELPGAVILYSNIATQTLKTENQRAQAEYVQNFKKAYLRIFGSYTRNEVAYTDSSYLNAQGFLYNTYTNHIASGGVNYAFFFNGNTFSVATEEQVSTMNSNLQGFGIPHRWHNFSAINWHNDKRNFLHWKVQLSSQLVEEWNEDVKRKTTARLNPFVQLETREFVRKNRWGMLLNYRNSFRMPSFNELYYNNIGNTSLKPEDAHQFALGFLFSTDSPGKKNKAWKLTNRSNIFYNCVKNKIVAVPTKNLFIWSMQNIGKVEIAGLETTFDVQYQLSKKWLTSLMVNYTFQHAVDKTDKNGPTYNDQVAYMPLHTVNADFTLKRRESGLRFSTFSNSERYALNENIAANRIDGFVIADAGIFTRLKLKNNDLRLQFTCKNLFNSSYAIVKYFVMPGRNYLISLNYAFN